MIYEFEGKTEKEAVGHAIKKLGLEKDQFDVELVDTEKGGLFNFQKKVHIRVHTQKTIQPEADITYYNPNPKPENKFESDLVDFLGKMIGKMGYKALVTIMYRDEKKMALRLDSAHSGTLIGRKGKNLDAIQLLANIFSLRYSDDGIRIVIDTENYRGRREEALIRLAHKVGDQVISTRKSQLLEPMNPFERRLIHTALSDIESIETMSEGDGLMKQVRVNYKGV